MPLVLEAGDDHFADASVIMLALWSSPLRIDFDWAYSSEFQVSPHKRFIEASL